MSNRVLLFSIKRKYWEMILRGEKKAELRKTCPKIWCQEVLFYVTGEGYAAVVGQANITHTETFGDKANPCHSKYININSFECGLSREEFDAYYEGSPRIVIFHLERPVLFRDPVPLTKYRVSQPPQSWCYAYKAVDTHWCSKICDLYYNCRASNGDIGYRTQPCLEFSRQQKKGQ